ncbi:MAG TPA: LuxR C-terminal-related transcriptional regulator, partial [Candidatus Baltobacteraceae bacterium]|nr:LuxR C-terminal-related transcriptional regulator [Candidatus Baltobacteraceae bacterium]
LIDFESPFLHVRKQMGMALAFCACAESLAGRTTSASRILQRLNGEALPVIEALRDIVLALCRAVKNQLLKDDALERLQALDAMGYGGVRKVVSQAIERSVHLEAAGDGILTPAELAVLHALSEGRGPKDIALETGRSVYTVQVHIKNIIKKLGCSGRNEALIIARRRGLVG